MALELLDQAIALDPEYPLASALAAWCHQQQVAYMWSTDRDASRKNAVRLARQAVSISEDDPLVLTVLGTVQTLARNHEAATPLIERALAIDPNFAWGWNRSGWLRTYKNEPEPAIRDFERAIRLSPLDPMNFNCFMGIAAAHSCAERYEQAIYWVKKALAERPGIVWANRGLVMPYVYLGRMEEARAAIATLLYEYPDLTVRQVIDSVPWGPEILSRYADAFREAGLPE